MSITWSAYRDEPVAHVQTLPNNRYECVCGCAITTSNDAALEEFLQQHDTCAKGE
jgi:hypothetical protein